jgi:hypothetical protein
LRQAERFTSRKNRLWRVVKTVHIEHLRRVTVSENDGRRIKSQTELTQESTKLHH